jgi:hypothetical protein
MNGQRETSSACAHAIAATPFLVATVLGIVAIRTVVVVWLRSRSPRPSSLSPPWLSPHARASKSQAVEARLPPT